MSFWGIMWAVIGGLLLIGIVVDLIAKMLGKKVVVGERDRKSTDPKRIDSENQIHMNIKNNTLL